jgi:enediyne biosynthesis protein E4
LVKLKARAFGFLVDAVCSCGRVGNGLPAEAQAPSKPTIGSDPFAVLKEIIEQKVAAYAAYNQISNQLFVRNLQVDFARRRCPADPAEGAQLKSYIAQSITNFATDL